MIAVLYELSECFSRNVGAVEDPLFHTDEVFHKVLVVHVLEKPFTDSSGKVIAAVDLPV